MTGDELERAIQFLLESQAKNDAQIARNDTQIARLTGDFAELRALVREFAESTRLFAERADERLGRLDRKLDHVLAGLGRLPTKEEIVSAIDDLNDAVRALKAEAAKTEATLTSLIQAVKDLTAQIEASGTVDPAVAAAAADISQTVAEIEAARSPADPPA